MQSPLIITILSALFFFHDYHATHTTLHYNGERESIEMTIKVAIEDLERALEDKGAKDLRLGTDKESRQAEQLIINYLRQRLKIIPNNKPMEYAWVGKEVSKDLHDLYLYVEIADCNKNGKIESISVENSIFTEIFSDQANMVLFEFGDSKHTLTFTKARNRGTVTVN